MGRMQAIIASDVVPAPFGVVLGGWSVPGWVPGLSVPWVPGLSVGWVPGLPVGWVGASVGADGSGVTLALHSSVSGIRLNPPIPVGHWPWSSMQPKEPSLSVRRRFTISPSSHVMSYRRVSG